MIRLSNSGFAPIHALLLGFGLRSQSFFKISHGFQVGFRSHHFIPFRIQGFARLLGFGPAAPATCSPRPAACSSRPAAKGRGPDERQIRFWSFDFYIFYNLIVFSFLALVLIYEIKPSARNLRLRMNRYFQELVSGSPISYSQSYYNICFG